MATTGGERPRVRIHYPYDNGSAGTGWHGLKERPLSPPLSEVVLPRLSRLKEGSVVVNLGCGDGNFELHAPNPANRPYRFLSLDQSAAAVGSLHAELYARRQEGDSFPDRAGVADITTPGLLEGEQVAAVVSSRVLHALDSSDHQKVLQTVSDALPSGEYFYWSALADTDWKRRELEAAGQYKPNSMNDCFDVMKLDQIGRSRSEPWMVHFFSKEYIGQLADQFGFEVEALIPFQEPTSFDHLAADADPAHNTVDYYFAVFKKRDKSTEDDLPARRAREN